MLNSLRRWIWYVSPRQNRTGWLTGVAIGMTEWNPSGLLGVNPPGLAFKIDGQLNCGATWPSLSPAGGTLSAGISSTLAATVNSNGLGPGRYSTNICVASNDPAKPLVSVPIQVNVTP